MPTSFYIEYYTAVAAEQRSNVFWIDLWHIRVSLFTNIIQYEYVWVVVDKHDYPSAFALEHLLDGIYLTRYGFALILQL